MWMLCWEQREMLFLVSMIIPARFGSDPDHHCRHSNSYAILSTILLLLKDSPFCVHSQFSLFFDSERLHRRATIQPFFFDAFDECQRQSCMPKLYWSLAKRCTAQRIFYPLVWQWNLCFGSQDSASALATASFVIIHLFVIHLTDNARHWNLFDSMVVPGGNISDCTMSV